MGLTSRGYSWSLPVVAETWDGDLNDINGFHVKAEDAFDASIARMEGPSRKETWAAERE